MHARAVQPMSLAAELGLTDEDDSSVVDRKMSLAAELGLEDEDNPIREKKEERNRTALATKGESKRFTTQEKGKTRMGPVAPVARKRPVPAAAGEKENDAKKIRTGSKPQSGTAVAKSTATKMSVPAAKPTKPPSRTGSGIANGAKLPLGKAAPRRVPTDGARKPLA
jgi:hypothetical protein